MGFRLYFGLTFIITWFYFCIQANIIQQHAEIKYFDTRYVESAIAFTGRRRRGEPYLTNITFVSKTQMGNNISTKIVANVKSVGTIVFHDMKFCDGLKIIWIKMMKDAYTNFTTCPMPAGTYRIFNLELPPKNFPLPIPKGEGILHMYVYQSQNKTLLLHGVMDVVVV